MGEVLEAIDKSNDSNQKAFDISIVRIQKESSQLFENAIKEFADVAVNTSIDNTFNILTRDDRIAEEVKNYIIRQDFIFRKYTETISLEWAENSSDYLKKYTEVCYGVENLSNKLLLYQNKFSLENPHEEKFPGFTKFDRIEIYAIDPDTKQRGEKLIDYDADKIRGFIKGDIVPTLNIEAESIPIGEKSIIEVRATLQDIQRINHFQPILVGRISDEIEVIVAHPQDVEVSIEAMHPSAHRLITRIRDIPNLKHWHLETGILPFQGVQLSWIRKELDN